MKKFLWISLCVIGMCFIACKNEVKETPAPKIDYKLFFKNPEKSGFQVSNDGKYFSYRADWNGKMNIFVQGVTDSQVKQVTFDSLRSIRRYFWKNGKIVYLQDVGGDENFQLFSVNPDGSGWKSLTPFPGIRTDIIDGLEYIPGKENLILVGINKRSKEYFDPFELDIQSGKLTLLYKNKENYDSWITDNTGTIRVATKTDGVNITYLHRKSSKDSFTELLTTSYKEQFSPNAFDATNTHMYVMSNVGRDKVSLVEYDPMTKKEVKELHNNNKFDLGGIFYDRQKQKLVNVSWTADKTEEFYFDEEWKAIDTYLDSQWPGYEVSLTSWDDNRSKAILHIGSDKLPAKFYLYDFNTKAVKEVANGYPWLNEGDMAPMKPVSFKSRDGLTIHGYLTLPKGIPAKNIPVIINPHGGPWARDQWGYDPEVQFLANRGYAVFQLNFRGSTGYGKQFWMSSFKEWGKKMQDDITDGVEYLKKEGIADPKRIAIYGGSYGGYATLAGITFTPDLYACAIDYVGVSNLFTFMNTIPPYWKPYLDQFYEMVGDPKKDSVLLYEASPVKHADKIKAPLFVAQGANDPRVNIAESDQMVEALRKRGVEVEYMVKKDEGHGFLNEGNRFDFYGAMENFLDKHLKKETLKN